MIGVHRHILGICGTVGAGKHSAAKIVASRYGYELISIGRLVELEMDDEDIPKDRETALTFAKKRMVEGDMDYWVKRIVEIVDSKGGRNVVIEGIRSPEDVEYLRNRFGGFKLLYVDADQLVRLRRVVSEKRDGFLDDLDDFKDYEDKLNGIFGSDRLQDVADVEIWNTGDLMYLEKEIGLIMKTFRETLKNRAQEMDLNLAVDENAPRE